MVMTLTLTLPQPFAHLGQKVLQASVHLTVELGHAAFV
jgi:hypothetical protein